MVMAAMLVLAASLAANTASPPGPSQPAPFPAAIMRLGIRPLTFEAYESSYAAKLQNAKLAGKPNPEKVAASETEDHRIREYPGELKLSQRKRLYRLERAWIEKERARRQFGEQGAFARKLPD